MKTIWNDRIQTVFLLDKPSFVLCWTSSNERLVNMNLANIIWFNNRYIWLINSVALTVHWFWGWQCRWGQLNLTVIIEMLIGRWHAVNWSTLLINFIMIHNLIKISLAPFSHGHFTWYNYCQTVNNKHFYGTESISNQLLSNKHVKHKFIQDLTTSLTYHVCLEQIWNWLLHPSNRWWSKLNPY